MILFIIKLDTRVNIFRLFVLLKLLSLFLKTENFFCPYFAKVILKAICFSLSQISCDNFLLTRSRDNHKPPYLLISLKSFSFSNNSLASLFFASSVVFLFSFLYFLISHIVIFTSLDQSYIIFHSKSFLVLEVRCGMR